MFILSDNNELLLFIKTKKNNLEQISFKIGQNEKRLYYELPLDVKLNVVRSILNSRLECDVFGDNYLFEHPKYGEIDIKDERTKTLNDIIDKNDGNLIKLSKTKN